MTTIDKKLKGLFVNTWKAQCSIHESGKMCFAALQESKLYELEYQEVNELNRVTSAHYDFYIFNYHQVTMGWLDLSKIESLPGFKCTIVLEVSPNSPFVMVSPSAFDAYLVLDPTINTINSKVYAFPRPLEQYHRALPQLPSHGIPIIGSFGFATKGKGFEAVIDAVNREFDKAIININIPKGDYVEDSEYNKLVNSLKQIELKPSVKLKITDFFYSKEELIEWCASNTLNVFLYTRTIPGLSATTDQAIVSGRPLAVSTNITFRHIHQYLDPYPYTSLKESIANSSTQVAQMKKDWESRNFATQFEEVLKENAVVVRKSSATQITLPKIAPIERGNPSLDIKDFLPPILGKLKRKLFRSIGRSVEPVMENHMPTLQPFMHYVLQSYSQHNEDLLIDLLLGEKKLGFYVDVGANHPEFNSNTKRFYNRGWNGINAEPHKVMFKKLQSSRKRDINLNVAVSSVKDALKFYQLSDDSSLSTLDFPTAQNMAARLGLEIRVSEIQVCTLEEILDQYLNNTAIDFLSVDAEGHDLNVLKSNNWKRYRPSVVMIESNYEFAQILEFMDQMDYLHIFSNHYNAIFVDKRSNLTALRKSISWR